MSLLPDGPVFAKTSEAALLGPPQPFAPQGECTKTHARPDPIETGVTIGNYAGSKGGLWDTTEH